MDRLWQLALTVPRATMVPVVLGVALAVLVLLGPTVFLRDREPFNRLMEFLDLVLGRPAPPRREPPGLGQREAGDLLQQRLSGLLRLSPDGGAA
jgi:hypothetical protein